MVVSANPLSLRYSSKVTEGENGAAEGIRTLAARFVISKIFSPKQLFERLEAEKNI